MDQKKGLMPIVLLLIICTALSLWVWKTLPAQSEAEGTPAEMELEQFDLQLLLAEGKPVLIDISSDSCPYCVIMEPELAEAYRRNKETAVIRVLNVDEQLEAAIQLQTQIPVQFRATPMQIFINGDGTPYQPSEAVLNQIAFLYYREKGTERHLSTVHEGMLTAEQMTLILQDMERAL